MTPANTSANYYLVAMLRTAGLTEADVTLVPLPPAKGDVTGMDQMSDALLSKNVDVISIWEPESEDAIQQLGDDAIVLQDRSVYREVFNLHTTATALADPEKRRSIVEMVRSIVEATKQLNANPQEHWPHISSVLKYSPEQIAASWPEMEFPAAFVPDLLDVLVEEEAWVAKERDRTPRGRDELAKLIDRSVLEEALAAR
jgi:NitT/TauT family transport system substrate-binding protein